MKILSLLFLTIFLGKGCAGQNMQDLKDSKIEYTANTRGFYQKIVIENQMVSVSKDRNETDKPVKTKISDADWKELTDCFKTIVLDSIPKLKAPTEKRFYDGAAIANLKVMYKDSVYESNSFDHGFPPVKIKKLVNKINSFAKQKDED